MILRRPFNFSEEEEWAEGATPKENEDILKSTVKEDEPEWQQEESNIEEKGSMVEEGENSIEENFEDGDDAPSLEKHIKLESEDVAGQHERCANVFSTGAAGGGPGSEGGRRRCARSWARGLAPEGP
ncbi:jg22878 [Pararge aegeria aegeria]|uniref:Jg22878 protein n=1 Tax=Pararge aegeria aegeria TaxID=348720 RepID=A0A8S4RUW2_9NEOP|nr:jg22878 [Pararge aegeria aegeria]